MRVKKNDYVRFIDGTLGKVAKYDYDKSFEDAHTFKLKGKDYSICCKYLEFTHSKQLINVVVIGDLVNNMIVEDICTYDEDGNPCEKYLKCTGMNYICNNDIKIIVTKEQLESVQYVVGGK